MFVFSFILSSVLKDVAAVVVVEVNGLEPGLVKCVAVWFVVGIIGPESVVDILIAFVVGDVIVNAEDLEVDSIVLLVTELLSIEGCVLEYSVVFEVVLSEIFVGINLVDDILVFM